MHIDWILIGWTAIASVTLWLATVHLLVWLNHRAEWVNLCLSLGAAATAVMAIIEFLMMRAETPEQMGTAMRWLHVPAWVIVLSLTAFTLLYLQAGRRWLAGAVCALQTFSLLLNFLVEPNISYREITGVRQIPFLGESISVADGVANPWGFVVQLSLLLFSLFILDAAIAVWRRGNRRLALVMGGGIMFFVLSSPVLALFVVHEPVDLLFTANVFFLPVVLGMMYEIETTARKRSELALRTAEERLSIAIDVAGLGFFEMNRDLSPAFMDNNYRSMMGLPHDQELRAREHWLEHVHPADRAHTLELSRSIREGEADRVQATYRYLHPERGVLWFSHIAKVTDRSPDGKMSRLFGVVEDITKRMQAEQEVEAMRNELAHLSRVTMLSELSGSLAHELNQPLTAILSNAQAALRFLARDQPDLGEVREILLDIVSDDKRAGEVIKGLRLLFKRGEMRQELLDMNEMVRDALRLVRSDMLNSRVQLITELAQALPKISADPVQLRQVLLNLMVNACDAMSAIATEERKLIVRSVFTDEGYVQIDVSDRGSGVSPEHLERLFEPFFTTKTHGLGLGLAVSRTIVAGHNGHLWVTNNPGREGATFHLALPSNHGSAA